MGGVSDFGQMATGLARNPLGIIALFIVLVYGLAVSTLIISKILTKYERLPIVGFLVIFPFAVLFVFAWLVSAHSGKLFSPSDFKDERNYITAQQQVAVASLGAASGRRTSSFDEFYDIISSVRAINLTESNAYQMFTRRVLWVDDKPENNVYEMQAFKALGIEISLSSNTKDALEKLLENKYKAVISNMGRIEGQSEGYVLLKAMREKNDATPVFFYTSSDLPEHNMEAISKGASGSTNRPDELFRRVTAILFG